jgi:hypothetical protein
MRLFIQYGCFLFLALYLIANFFSWAAPDNQRYARIAVKLRNLRDLFDVLSVLNSLL